MPTWEYDQQETRKAAQQLLFGAAFTTFLVFQFSFNQVLLIQAVMLVRGAFSSPVVQIHLFGRPATDALKRPFVTASPFAYGQARQRLVQAGRLPKRAESVCAP